MISSASSMLSERVSLLLDVSMNCSDSCWCMDDDRLLKKWRGTEMRVLMAL